MPGLFDDLKPKMQGLFSEPTTTQLLGMQLMANSGPSVGAPRNMFEGMPQTLMAGQQLEQGRRDRVAEGKLLAGKKSWLAQARPDLAAQVDGGLDFNTAYDQAVQEMFAKPEAPKMETLYDEETGQAYKAAWNPTTGEFDRIGGMKAPSGPLVENNIGAEPSDSALRKSLDTADGKNWATYKDIANQSASLAQDMEVLDELIQHAPQGMLTGRLAEAFPGISSAGAAFNSVVKRVAPTLRAEGSGSTSDIEYEGMLQALPALRNKPEANAMIAQIMKEKAKINIERGNIIARYQNNEIDVVTARKALQELNSRSILTPEMKLALDGLSPKKNKGGTTQSGISWSID